MDVTLGQQHWIRFYTLLVTVISLNSCYSHFHKDLRTGSTLPEFLYFIIIFMYTLTMVSERKELALLIRKPTTRHDPEPILPPAILKTYFPKSHVNFTSHIFYLPSCCFPKCFLQSSYIPCFPILALCPLYLSLHHCPKREFGILTDFS
jgi:hypothetical protein